MRVPAVLLLGPVLVVAFVGAGYGQDVAANVASRRSAAVERPVSFQQVGQEVYRDSTWKMVVSGVGLGAAGFVVGGVAAGSLSTGEGWNDAFFGAAALGTLGMAVGVHLGNARRGDLALDVLAGAAVWTAGYVVLSALDRRDLLLTPGGIFIPVLQLAAVVSVESAVARKRAEARRTSLSIVPSRDGGIAVDMSVTF
jgi:hypothetical protein